MQRMTIKRQQPSRLGKRTMAGKNVLGSELEVCGTDPMTGFFRDGCCNTGAQDAGLHVVCVQVTAQFLQFSKARGNDLTTPNPMYQFPGLVPGDRWCLAPHAGRRPMTPAWRRQWSWKRATFRRLNSHPWKSCKSTRLTVRLSIVREMSVGVLSELPSKAGTGASSESTPTKRATMISRTVLRDVL